ncbi:MAG: cytosine permease [Clostridiales Family XIII bacterium]|jgi:NCS1 family nucleobase:cation symporter-1|nr:cytosine permease [Clostridiales Family XIII bacterium]
MAAYTQKQRDGLYELTEQTRAELTGTRYFNEDLAPTSLADRTWNTFHISMLWVGMSICIPSFMMASGLVGLGLSPFLAVLNVIIGNVLILIPIQLNSHAGTKYGIPFPVFARLTFGINGAHLPSLSRAVTACGWNAVQCGVGGVAILSMIKAFAPGFDDTSSSALWVGFFIFLVITWVLTAFGSVVIRIFESIGSPVLIVLSITLFIWAILIGADKGYSFTDIITSNISAGNVTANGGFLIVFLGGLTSNIGFWATMALNIPDFSRYAKDQKAQFRGQLYGMPLAMAACAVIGAFYAQATFLANLTGDNTPLFSPADALHYIGEGPAARIIMFVVGFGVVIATLTTNIAANVVAPANGFSNISPKRITYRMGATLACIIAVGYYAISLNGSTAGAMFTFLNVYGGILAPVAAIFIADYYIVKKKNVDVKALYLGSTGRYWYSNGFNVKAFIAWFCGAIIPTLVSIFPGSLGQISVLSFINTNAYIFAFVVAFIIYLAIMNGDTKATITDADEAAMTE